VLAWTTREVRWPRAMLILLGLLSEFPGSAEVGGEIVE